MNEYKDIINLSHYEPRSHPRMSIYSRSAQFAPFAALTGYSESVKETARQTDEKIELNDESKEMIDLKLHEIASRLSEKPTIEIIYFVKDKKKSGGKYITKKDRVTKIDLYNSCLFFREQKIFFDDILNIEIK